MYKAHRDRKKKSKKRDVTGWGMAVQNANKVLLYDPASPHPGLE